MEAGDVTDRVSDSCVEEQLQRLDLDLIGLKFAPNKPSSSLMLTDIAGQDGDR